MAWMGGYAGWMDAGSLTGSKLETKSKHVYSPEN